MYIRCYIAYLKENPFGTLQIAFTLRRDINKRIGVSNVMNFKIREMGSTEVISLPAKEL